MLKISNGSVPGFVLTNSCFVVVGVVTVVPPVVVVDMVTSEGLVVIGVKSDVKGSEVLGVPVPQLQATQPSTKSNTMKTSAESLQKNFIQNNKR